MAKRFSWPIKSNPVHAAYQAAFSLHQAGKLQEAERGYRQLLRSSPNHTSALHYLGVICLQTQRLEEAETLISRSLQQQEDASALLNLSLVCQALNQSERAMTLLERVLALTPNNAQATNNLANEYLRQGEVARALTLYRRGTELNPGYLLNWMNLGVCLRNENQFDEAETALRQALALNPQHYQSATILSSLLENRKQWAEAIALCERVNDIASLCRLKRKSADWQGLDTLEAQLHNLVVAEHQQEIDPHTLINYPWLTRELHRNAARQFAQIRWPMQLANPLPHPAHPTNARLKIGYLSADFFDHATMHLLAGVLEAHDTERYDIHLYCYSPKKSSDNYTQRLADSGLPLHYLRGISDKAAAQQIMADNVDILVDLKGFTTYTRLGITAYRPAPITVSWLGYPGSLGHPALADYIIGDAQVTPVSHAGDYSETLALMPDSYQPNDRNRPLPAPLSRKDVGLPDNAVVLCSFNQIVKYSPALFTLWSRVLNAVPNTVLWLLDGNSPVVTDNLRREMVERGIATERIIFAPFMKLEQHLARLQLADIALDTFPCNSHTTASDALWAGVPLVSYTGETFASRVATSLLHAANVPELIAADENSWLQLTCELANDAEKRATIRQRLIAGRQTSALFDTQRFTRNLEQLYDAMWAQRDQPREQRTTLVLEKDDCVRGR